MINVFIKAVSSMFVLKLCDRCLYYGFVFNGYMNVVS